MKEKLINLASKLAFLLSRDKKAKNKRLKRLRLKAYELSARIEEFKVLKKLI